MKRKNMAISILILAVLAFLPAAVSCSAPEGSSDSGKTDSENDFPPNSAEGNMAAEVAEPFPEPEVPEKDYGGIQFNILYPEWGMYEDYLFSDEESGDVMNDAMFKRDKAIEDRLNIRFNKIMIAKGKDEIKQVLPMVKNSVMAGDGSYDLALIHPMCDLNTFAQSQLVRNWNKMPHVDLSKPYWNQSMNDTLAVNGILLFAANDFIIPNPTVIYANKNLLRDYGMENPYELVRSGKWTWDKFAEMAKQVSRDINGDGIYDENDLYGFTLLLDGSGMISMMHACNQFIAKKDEDGVPKLDLMSEKLVSLIDKIYDLVWVGNQTYTWTTEIWDAGKESLLSLHQNFFPRGHALFAIGSPGTGANEFFRASEVDFGILPYPKYDEAQKDYISLEHAGLMLVPMDAKDPEMAGIVAELLGSESRRYTIPIYYDVQITYKGVRDEESLEMLQLIFNNTVYDFGYNYSNFTNTAYIVPRVIAQKSRDVGSFYEANARSTEKDLEKAYENLVKYEDLDF